MELLNIIIKGKRMSSIYKDENSEEWFFPSNSYILSETDSKGIILYAMKFFMR